ncbi:hypothetical protein [Nocardia arthritidis]|uniref:ATP synthase subunit I n=1 Tax=Nocardia arthritidis TaxID=228602 RepID=A0A6G9Y8R0_9NOCA|nr:hypothetical protein [Nocardia arthritidis]QIS09558.1 hypothetical protein F5544_08280 [Nocardia arthritidis]
MPVSVDRRPVLAAAVFGLLASAVTGAIGRPLLGGFLCAGLILGFGNALITRWGVSGDLDRSRLAATSALRLLAVTVISLVIGYFVRPDGIGIFFGLTAFHVIMALHMGLPAPRRLRS